MVEGTAFETRHTQKVSGVQILSPPPKKEAKASFFVQERNNQIVLVV